MDDLVKRLRDRRAYWIGAGMEPDPLCHEAATALEAKDAELARITAIAHIALDNWASWVHDQLDGTGMLDEAIAEIDGHRAALQAKE
jgi:hypothetical protein